MSGSDERRQKRKPRGNGRERGRERERRSALIIACARLSLSTPAWLPSAAFVFLVIVAVPSGGRLWLASRREKQTEERRTERQEEDRRTEADSRIESGEADISRSAKGGRESTPEN